MNLGQYSSYPLPASLKTAFGANTAQELADQLGLEGELSPQLATKADAAYNSYRSGDAAPARALLIELGMSDAAAGDALAKLP